MDTYSYKGWLNSDNFWKRALAIYGYSLALMLVAWLIFAVFSLMVAFLAGMIGMHF